MPSGRATARADGGLDASGAARAPVGGDPREQPAPGDPSALGIDDLDRPDFGEAVYREPDDIPVFWACGVTPQAAVMASRPPFALTHAPGQMFLTDARDEQYRVA